MRAVILYHPQSDHIGRVEEYSQDFKRFKGKDLEKISLESAEGDQLAKLYDVTSYPAILVIGPDGMLVQLWQNGIFPLMDQVSAAIGEPQDIVSHTGHKILFPAPGLAAS